MTVVSVFEDGTVTVVNEAPDVSIANGEVTIQSSDVLDGQLPGQLDIRCIQGATFELIHNWVDDDLAANNLTGYTSRLQVRDKKTGAILLEDAAASGILTISLGGAAGTITYAITAANTAALHESTDCLKYEYDVELIDGSSNVLRLLEGDWIVAGKEITR